MLLLVVVGCGGCGDGGVDVVVDVEVIYHACSRKQRANNNIQSLMFQVAVGDIRHSIGTIFINLILIVNFDCFL